MARIDDFEWNELYKKTESFMNAINAHDFFVETNVKSINGNEPIVYVGFPKRINCVAMVKLDNHKACYRVRGNKINGILYCKYAIYVNSL